MKIDTISERHFGRAVTVKLIEELALSIHGRLVYATDECVLIEPFADRSRRPVGVEAIRTGLVAEVRLLDGNQWQGDYDPFAIRQASDDVPCSIFGIMATFLMSKYLIGIYLDFERANKVYVGKIDSILIYEDMWDAVIGLAGVGADEPTEILMGSITRVGFGDRYIDGINRTMPGENLAGRRGGAMSDIGQEEQEQIELVRQAAIERLPTSMSVDGVHGIAHWEKVREDARHLATHSGGDKLVVQLFAYLHDCCRESDGYDPDHGIRAATFAQSLLGGILDIDDQRSELLSYACEYHDKGLVSNDPTVGACWDADRLDLGRVGIIPDPDLMSTACGRMASTIEWGYRRSLGGESLRLSDFAPSSEKRNPLPSPRLSTKSFSW